MKGLPTPTLATLAICRRGATTLTVTSEVLLAVLVSTMPEGSVMLAELVTWVCAKPGAANAP